MELYRVQIKERKQRASESLPELRQTIRRLVNKAYPTAPGEVRETLAKEHFLDALVNTEMRIKIKQARPIDLNSAVCLAVELETFYKAERKFEGGKAHLRTVDNNDIETAQVVNNLANKIEDMYKTMNEQFANIKKELDEVKKNNVKPRTSNKSNPVCYNCGIPGHFSRECYSTTRNTGGIVVVMQGVFLYENTREIAVHCTLVQIQ
jgi:hypothetical protein